MPESIKQKAYLKGLKTYDDLGQNINGRRGDFDRRRDRSCHATLSIHIPMTIPGFTQDTLKMRLFQKRSRILDGLINFYIKKSFNIPL